MASTTAVGLQSPAPPRGDEGPGLVATLACQAGRKPSPSSLRGGEIVRSRAPRDRPSPGRVSKLETFKKERLKGRTQVQILRPAPRTIHIAASMALCLRARGSSILPSSAMGRRDTPWRVTMPVSPPSLGRSNNRPSPPLPRTGAGNGPTSMDGGRKAGITNNISMTLSEYRENKQDHGLIVLSDEKAAEAFADAFPGGVMFGARHLCPSCELSMVDMPRKLCSFCLVRSKPGIYTNDWSK